MTTHKQAKRQRFLRAVERANKATHQAYDLMKVDATIARRQPEARALVRDIQKVTELIRCADYPEFVSYTREADARSMDDFIGKWRATPPDAQAECASE